MAKWARGLGGVALAAALALAGPARAAEAGARAAFQVVVHPDNPVRALSREALARIFLKKTTEWPGGQRAEPVDLAPGSPVRAAFTEAVLRRSVPAVRAYWTQAIFSGRVVPPPELEGDEAVRAFVARTPWAVGYLSPRAGLAGVKVVPVGE